jgi:23S rRNA pseudouridine1911/1915/1917 synthase
MTMTAPLEILYADHHLVAVNKPARVPVASEDSGDETLLEMVRVWNAERQVDGKKGYCVPIHFLDRPVSGVIVFALSSKAAARLNEKFRDRKMKKTYIAVTEPRPRESAATLEHWLAKSHDENMATVSGPSDKDAKKCVLSYKVKEASGARAVVEVMPVTGRSHQIRAQMAAIGSPLVGDVKYGADKGWSGCIALHAAALEFDHPVGGRPMRIMAPVPAYWSEIWNGDISI